MTGTLHSPCDERPCGKLSVEGLRWRPYGRDAPVLNDISLRISPGERVLLVGAGGSGKSTLLRALAGLLDDSLGEQTGRVSLGGEPPGGTPGAAGLLLQDPVHGVVAEYAGRDAAFGPENRALPPRQVRDAAARSLDTVGFPYPADRRTDALSGGELQRLSLAGALALDPSVLLLDEPTAMLDDDAATTVREAVTHAADARGLTLVVVEHRLAGWLDVCDRIVVLSPAGTILADGPTRTVLTEQAHTLVQAGIWVPGQPPPAPSRSLREMPTDAPPALDRRQGSTSGTSALEAEGLMISAPDSDRILLRDRDLTLAPGETCGVLGRSGSGKTTLLRVLTGLSSPVTGRVCVADGEVLTDPATMVRRPERLARAVAWLPQHVEQLFTRRTVLDEVMATSEVIWADDPEAYAAARRRADRILDALGLSHLAGADPFQLSGGEQRRLALAAIVVHLPAVVVLDEPTVGQDRQTWAAVIGVIDAVRRSGCAVVTSTHDPLLPERQDMVIDLDHHDDINAAPVPAPDHRIGHVVESGSSQASRCNPTSLLIIALAAAVGSFWVDDWRIGAITLALSAVLAPLAIRRMRSLLRLVPVGIAALTVGWSTLLFSTRGFLAPAAIPVAVAEIVRIGCLVVPGALLVTGLQPSRLGDALAQNGRLPHRPVVAATSALLRVQQLLTWWRRMTEIRRVRGLAPRLSLSGRIKQVAQMTFALLVSTLRAAQEMALSMDARGFSGARHRTFALPSPWRARDAVCLLVALILCATPIVLSYLV